MRTFKKGNWTGKEVCPICKTKSEGEVVLIGIDNEVNGYNVRAIQVHLECLNLWFNKKTGIIYQKTKEKNGD